MQCKFCNREYKIKTYYNRHVITCELLSKTSKERRDIQECSADTPDIRSLYDIVLEMNKQIQDLRKKVIVLEKEKKAKHKKINILDWLNSQPSPPTTWKLWTDAIEVTRENLLETFKADMVSGILSRIEEKYDEDKCDKLPLRAFEQKPNIFYVYQEDEWIAINQKVFEKNISRLHKKYMMEFIKWRTDAEKELGSDAFTEQFTENIHKLTKDPIDQVGKKVMSKLHNKIKINIKHMIHYEFE
jgi:hypothetical protein